MERLVDKGVSASYVASSVHFGARPIVGAPAASGRPPPPAPYEPQAEQNAVPDFEEFFQLSGASPGDVELSAHSTLASYASNVHTTIVRITFAAAADSLAIKVPFRALAVSEVQASLADDPLAPVDIDVSPDGSYVVGIAIHGGPHTERIRISFKLWHLNDLLPYSPVMAFQRAPFELTPVSNVVEVSINGGLGHANRQGTVSQLIASVLVTIADPEEPARFRIRLPSLTQAVAAVVGSVQGVPAIASGAVFAENGDIFCSFVPSGGATSFVLSVTAHVADS